MSESLFNKVESRSPTILLKRNSNAGVFLWILRNFEEQLFLQNTSGGCFCLLKLYLQKDYLNTVRAFFWHVTGCSIGVYASYSSRVVSVYSMPPMNHSFMKCPHPLMKYPQILTPRVIFAVKSYVMSPWINTNIESHQKFTGSYIKNVQHIDLEKIYLPAGGLLNSAKWRISYL